MSLVIAGRVLGAGVVAIGALGAVAAAPTVHAAPACTDWVFNGDTTVVGGPGWGWTITFASTGKLVPGSVDFHKPPGSDAGEGPASGSGGIDGTAVRMVLNNIQFNGNVDENGNASGGTVFPTPGPNDPTWTLAAPLKCNTPVKVAPTDAVRMEIDKRPLTATVNVRNTSDLAGRCNYDATATSGVFAPPLHRDFDLGPNGTNSFDVPAPPLGSSYHVVLSCKGDFEGKQVEFGHVEQEVSSF
jgi:hypothetical protein